MVDAGLKRSRKCDQSRHKCWHISPTHQSQQRNFISILLFIVLPYLCLSFILWPLPISISVQKAATLLLSDIWKGCVSWRNGHLNVFFFSLSLYLTTTELSIVNAGIEPFTFYHILRITLWPIFAFPFSLLTTSGEDYLLKVVYLLLSLFIQNNYIIIII